MNRDKYGLIVQADGDDGDSLHRSCTAVIGYRNLGIYDQADKLMHTIIRELSFGHFEKIWTRGATKWVDPNTVSRDQMIPVVIMLGMVKNESGYYGVIFDQTIDAFGKWPKTPNGDLMIGHWSLVLRAKGKTSRVLLSITDLPLLLGIMVKCFVPFRWNDQKKSLEWADKDKVDDWNDYLPLLQATKSETPVSLLARFIYRNFRPRSYGLIGQEPGFSRVKAALKWYNRQESGGNPELVYLHSSSLDQYFNSSSGIRLVHRLVDRFSPVRLP